MPTETLWTSWAGCPSQGTEITGMWLPGVAGTQPVHHQGPGCLPRGPSRFLQRPALPAPSCLPSLAHLLLSRHDSPHPWLGLGLFAWGWKSACVPHLPHCEGRQRSVWEGSPRAMPCAEASKTDSVGPSSSRTALLAMPNLERCASTKIMNKIKKSVPSEAGMDFGARQPFELMSHTPLPNTGVKVGGRKAQHQDYVSPEGTRSHRVQSQGSRALGDVQGVCIWSL